MKTILDIPYSKKGEKCKLDFYLPEGEQYPVIVYFHGGGLVSGHRAEMQYREIGQCFAEAGYAFVSVGYRLYTDGVRFPDFLTDCAEAVAFAKEYLRRQGTKWLIAGQSAGGWMALLLCLNEQYLSAVGLAPAEIDGWIIDSAQMTSHFNVLKEERGIDPRLQRIDEFAPLYYVSDKTAFSKMLLLFYEQDMPCREEQNRLFMKAVRYFNPQADMEYQVLPGGHCHGSTKKEEDGKYRFVKESLLWLNKRYNEKQEGGL
jgi:dipeptidyl aminopeptidase/acylaminoacyl peptidase